VYHGGGWMIGDARGAMLEAAGALRMGLAR